MLCCLLPGAVLAAVAAAAWACGPQAGLFINPATGAPGSAVTFTGVNFTPGLSVTIVGPDSMQTPATVGSGGGFAVAATIPDVAPGVYVVFARGMTPDGYEVRSSPAVLEVTAPPPPAPPPPPPPVAVAEPAAPVLPSPELVFTPVSDALSAPIVVRPPARPQTIVASTTGAFDVVCGRTFRSGVSGTCAARSTAALPAGGRLITLRAKAFQARSGRPIRVRHRLTLRQLKLLSARRRLAMRATVTAQDARGNTGQAAFDFTLRAPRQGTGRRR